MFFVAVYLPPQTDAGTKITFNELYRAISKQENAHPKVSLLVAGDFNAGKLKSVIPHFYQHVKLANKGEKNSTTFTPHTEIRTKLSLALHLANLTIILSSLFLRTSKH
jgi:hypothetical protein